MVCVGMEVEYISSYHHYLLIQVQIVFFYVFDHDYCVFCAVLCSNQRDQTNQLEFGETTNRLE